MTTKLDQLHGSANLKVVSSLPATPAAFYGVATNDVFGTAWVGGEVVYHSGDSRIYIQTATSGTTATWKRLLDTFATSTTSSSTSTSTSTSSTTSTSTSTSSTTTMA